jgi:hypothetical protein
VSKSCTLIKAYGGINFLERIMPNQDFVVQKFVPNQTKIYFVAQEMGLPD